jgi:hypothetical protein
VRWFAKSAALATAAMLPPTMLGHVKALERRFSVVPSSANEP